MFFKNLDALQPEKAEIAEQLNALVYAFEIPVMDHRCQWEAFAVIFTFDYVNNAPLLQQVDPIFYREGRPASFDYFSLAVLRPRAADTVTKVSGGREFEKAVLTVTHVKGQEGSDASLYFDDNTTDYLITPDTWWRVAERINPTLTREPVEHVRHWTEGVAFDAPLTNAADAVLSDLRPHIEGYSHAWQDFTAMFYVVNDEGTLGLARAVCFYYIDKQPSDHDVLETGPQLDADACTLAATATNGDVPAVTTVSISYRGDRGRLRFRYYKTEESQGLWVTPDTWHAVAQRLNPHKD